MFSAAKGDGDEARDDELSGELSRDGVADERDAAGEPPGSGLSWPLRCDEEELVVLVVRPVESGLSGGATWPGNLPMGMFAYTRKSYKTLLKC